MNKIYLHALNLIPRLGNVNLKRLLQTFTEPADIWSADLHQLRETKLPDKILYNLIRERQLINPETAWRQLEKAGVSVISFFEDKYPPLLKEIFTPPFILYLKGNPDLGNRNNLAIVGTRKNSQYSQRILAEFIPDLVSHFVIVSGLALGVDAIAHQETLNFKGKTVAVLGCGLDQIYPRANSRLASQILDQGSSLISEYPPGTQPFKQHFPARNRLISGMSQGTLVVEGPIGSGALITAAFALEQNREVLAIPGSIFSSKSQGCNQLVQMGAKSVVSANNILEVFNLDLTKNSNKIILKPTTREEKVIVEILEDEPAHLDKIVIISKLDTSTINATLLNLELKGVIRNLGGQNFQINR
ncbi:DNA-processing protein DprA [Patescibacteria group bacterium]|nr:DNA-processing protein DprA [Patescibacteria group bacterium]